jgi:hypothetical protein
MEKGTVLLGIAALALVLTGCGSIMNDSDNDALYELDGSWYDNRYDFAFEITQSGEGYIAGSKTQCAVSSSGSFVYFRDSHGNLMGSFNYSIKNGELTMTLGRGDFSGIQSSSPFIKSGGTPSGGAIPVEFIGKWYTENNPPPSPSFEITKSGIMKTTVSGSAAQYTAIVAGNKIAVLDGVVLQGEFQYSFMYGKMFITNGTDLCAGLQYLSPFVKKNS